MLSVRKADAHAVQQQLAFSRGDAPRHCLVQTAKADALRRSHSMMSDKAAAGVYCVHQTQTRCGALTMQTTTAPVSTSRRAAATPTAATHGHHFSTQVAVQHRLQHVNDRITQDAQLVLTAVHEDAGVDGDVDGEDDDVVVVTSR